MRDIQNDLQERADLIQDHIKAAAVHFERMVEQLRNEHDARVADLKLNLAMIAKLMEFEGAKSQANASTGGLKLTNGKRPGGEVGGERRPKPTPGSTVSCRQDSLAAAGCPLRVMNSWRLARRSVQLPALP